MGFGEPSSAQKNTQERASKSKGQDEVKSTAHKIKQDEDNGVAEPRGFTGFRKENVPTSEHFSEKDENDGEYADTDKEDDKGEGEDSPMTLDYEDEPDDFRSKLYEQCVPFLEKLYADPSNKQAIEGIKDINGKFEDKNLEDGNSSDRFCVDVDFIIGQFKTARTLDGIMEKNESVKKFSDAWHKLRGISNNVEEQCKRKGWPVELFQISVPPKSEERLEKEKEKEAAKRGARKKEKGEAKGKERQGTTSKQARFDIPIRSVEHDSDYDLEALVGEDPDAEPPIFQRKDHQEAPPNDIYQKQPATRRHFNVHRDIFRAFFGLDSLIHITSGSMETVAFQTGPNAANLEPTNAAQSVQEVAIAGPSNAKSTSNEAHSAEPELDTDRNESIPAQPVQDISRVPQDTSEATARQVEQPRLNTPTLNATKTNANQTECNSPSAPVPSTDDDRQIPNVEATNRSKRSAQQLSNSTWDRYQTRCGYGQIFFWVEDDKQNWATFEGFEDQAARPNKARNKVNLRAHVIKHSTEYKFFQYDATIGKYAALAVEDITLEKCGKRRKENKVEQTDGTPWQAEVIERDGIIVAFKYVNLNNDDREALHSRVSTAQPSSIKERLDDLDKLINRKRKRERGISDEIDAIGKKSKTREEEEEM